MTTGKSVNAPVKGLVVGTTPTLVGIYGPLSGHTFNLDEPFVSIGRLASNSICVKDQFVSRHHCVIRKHRDEYLLEDLNSANGTYVNGERVNASSLKERSLIDIGDSRFLFRTSEPPTAEVFDHQSIGSDPDLFVAENGRSRLNEIGLG